MKIHPATTAADARRTLTIGTSVQRANDKGRRARYFGRLGTVVEIDTDEERSHRVEWDDGQYTWEAPSKLVTR